MEVWEHANEQFEYQAFYHLDDDGWVHEVVSLSGGGDAWLLIPDATPDSEAFTPIPDRAVFRSNGATLPLAVVERLLTSARDAGDLGPGSSAAD